MFYQGKEDRYMQSGCKLDFKDKGFTKIESQKELKFFNKKMIL